jgi:hypothetical protein
MNGIRARLSRPICTGLLALGVLMSSCSSPNSTASSSQSSSTALRAPAPELWGDLKPIVSVKELMRDMLDPASDFIFDSVGTEVTKQGTIERLPKTDADWEKIRFGAVTLAEGVYLLKIPRPFAPPGDENNSTGPDPEELSPAQIKAKLEKDPVLWNAKIEALRNVGLEVMDIVKRKDVKELWDASDNLDHACENCHLEYWYPGELKLLDSLDRKLRNLDSVRADRSRSQKAK